MISAAPMKGKYTLRAMTSAAVRGNRLLGRNWAFSIALLHASGRESDFLIGSGLSLDGEFDPSNLLGGEFLALPKKAQNKETAIQLMKFLLSKEVQSKVVRELSWPAMRLDVEGQLSPWQKRYQKVLKTALLHASPTPAYWSRQMADIYEEIFDEIVDPTSSPFLDLERLNTWEAEIGTARSTVREAVRRALSGS